MSSAVFALVVEALVGLPVVGLMYSAVFALVVEALVGLPVVGLPVMCCLSLNSIRGWVFSSHLPRPTR